MEHGAKDVLLAGVACGFVGPLCPDTRRGREATADEDESFLGIYISRR